ncbi:MAG: hypothetical protein ACHQQQ_00685 [Bacteroidota bacterium]
MTEYFHLLGRETNSPVPSSPSLTVRDQTMFPDQLYSMKIFRASFILRRLEGAYDITLTIIHLNYWNCVTPPCPTRRTGVEPVPTVVWSGGRAKHLSSIEYRLTGVG